MKKLLLFVFAALAFAACTQDVVVDITPAPIVDEVPETLVVGFEGDDTRIQLQNGKTVWTKGDLVSVFYKSDGNDCWKFTGETGERNGTLQRVSVGEYSRRGDYVIVAYPYNRDYLISLASNTIETTLPAVQEYATGSFGVGSSPMVAMGDYKQFALKNTCGWLKLQLTGNGEMVRSITLRGNNGEQVAGDILIVAGDASVVLADASIDVEDNEVGGSLLGDDDILKEVTLDCGEGVTLGKSATAFYIALPPQTFTKGLTVEITDDSGYTMTQATDKEVAIERNTIQPMAAIDFVNPNTPAQPTPASNEIWYTATAKADPYLDDFLTFGADVVSNVWDSETKRGIITFDGDVTMIGDDAFNNCDKLTSITLPECVTSIGKKAFYGCDGLTEFTIPDGVTTIENYAFAYCDSLKSVNIPDSVTTIGQEAFRSCTSLTSVNIPDSLTTIGEGAFSSCDSLTEFNGKFAEDNGRILVVDGVLTAFAPAGITQYTIPDSVTTIGKSAFDSCDSLASVNIGDSVTTIGEYAFYNCNSLTSVNIPESVTTIGAYAFAFCDSLASVTIGDSVTTIGNYAFAYCDSLKKVYCYATMPPALGYYGAFSSNVSVRRIYVYEECVELYKSAWSSYKDSIYTNGKNCPETTTIQYTTNDGNTITSLKLPIISNIYENGVGTLVFSGTKIPSSAFYGCDSLTSVTIGDSVTDIGDSAFAYCDSLTSVTIGDSVTTIENYAFEGCTSLTEFNGKFAEDNGRILVVDGVLTAFASAGITQYTIPDSVTTIGDYAFAYCDSLTSVNIPDSVTTIGKGAFYGCNRLTSVYCKATTPPALGGTNVFDYNGSGRKIYVPAGSVNAYKSAEYWNEYANDIFEDEF